MDNLYSSVVLIVRKYFNSGVWFIRHMTNDHCSYTLCDHIDISVEDQRYLRRVTLGEADKDPTQEKSKVFVLCINSHPSTTTPFGVGQHLAQHKLTYFRFSIAFLSVLCMYSEQ